jgi:exopolysaccharide biosynthesis polyprenyl glycosylphosphotransferase
VKLQVDSGLSMIREEQNDFPLLPAALAYLVSYLLLSRFNIEPVIRPGKPAGHRGLWLFAGLLLFWSTLVAIWEAGSVIRKGRKRWTQHFSRDLVFLGVLGSLYVSGVVPSGLFIFLVVGSLLYEPISSIFLRVGLHLRRAGRLIQHDSRILVIGSKDRAKNAIASIREAGEAYAIIGCLDPDPSSVGTWVADLEILGTTEDLGQYLFGQHVDLVMFALPLELVPGASEAIDKAMEVGIPVALVTESGLNGFSRSATNQKLSYQGFMTLPTMILSNVPGDSLYLVLKRVLDVAASLILLILLSPLFFLVAALIKITSPEGPVLYEWKVLGRNRKPFVGYKFRTMVANAEQLKTHLLQHNEMQGPVFKMQNDPRVTPLGRILRKYSIDELPQLYSVLKGDMSLVGPRPPAKEEADQFKFWQRRKLSVKPGITCLWQVNGRSGIASFDEWARLDIEYIERASMWCDLAILLRTIPAVVSGKGAH